MSKHLKDIDNYLEGDIDLILRARVIGTTTGRHSTARENLTNSFEQAYGGIPSPLAAHIKLTAQQQKEVAAALAEWGIKQMKPSYRNPLENPNAFTVHATGAGKTWERLKHMKHCFAETGAGKTRFGLRERLKQYIAETGGRAHLDPYNVAKAHLPSTVKGKHAERERQSANAIIQGANCPVLPLNETEECI